MSGNNDNIKLVTFGCRLNTFESQVMRDKAAEAGLGDERVRMVNLTPDDPQGFAIALQEAIAKARELSLRGVA